MTITHNTPPNRWHWRKRAQWRTKRLTEYAALREALRKVQSADNVGANPNDPFSCLGALLSERKQLKRMYNEAAAAFSSVQDALDQVFGSYVDSPAEAIRELGRRQPASR